VKLTLNKWYNNVVKYISSYSKDRNTRGININMHKLFKTIVISSAILCYQTYAQTNAATLFSEAAKAYTQGQSQKLYTLYNNNKNEPIVLYLYAKAALNRGDTSYAIYASDKLPHSYMRNDILHQLLISLYRQGNAHDYLANYKKLENTKISSAETCGYDLFNLRLGNQQATITDKQWLTTNDIGSWCADLGLSLYRKNQLSNSQFNRLLANLVINQDFDLFNKLAPQISLKPINFARHKNSTMHKLPQNQYLQIYYISSKAKKYPDEALNYLSEAHSISAANKTLLANYIAQQFAASQQFTLATQLFNQYYSDDISNSAFEWRTRSYIANKNWLKVISTINNMPQELQQDTTWQYWLGKAYQQTKQASKAKAIFAAMPRDYSYYYMLGQSELGQSVEFDHTLPNAVNVNDSKFNAQIERSLYLYQLGKTSNNKILTTIASYEWYYISRVAESKDLIAMSVVAHNQGYYDLSIASANKLNYRILYLSFPTPYYSLYEKYSRELKISPTFPLAVSRQESRFNSTIVAFDGGQGLMQIMPYTAKYISKKAHYASCGQLDAQCNIKYGTWYLGNLYKKFGSYIYAAAGYNGGPNRANRWQDRLSNLDTITQMEMIPITITRDYVQKVLVNNAIYTAKLNKTNEVNLLSFINNLPQQERGNNLNDDSTDRNKL